MSQIRIKRELLVGQTWKANQPKCRNLGGSKEILALCIITGKPNESRVVFRDQLGRKSWCSRASFGNWISAFKARLSRYISPSFPGPHIIIRKYCWDGWEAFVEDRVLVRARGDSPAAVFDSVMNQLHEGERNAQQ